jgi:hypothetical protein
VITQITSGRSIFAPIQRAFITAFLICTTANFPHAQAGAVKRNIKALPDRDIRAGIYTSIRPDCTSGPLPSIRLAAPPSHGNVSVKRATLKATNVKQCLAIDVPAFVAFYHAAQGFNGTDQFELEITFTTGRKEIQLFHVNVSNDPNSGQGI